ncbi:M48 family metalloprotease [Gallaecimonas sp. GXIMD4217]|uniref:M48 family metalloprotease n=1 Tax=Gallaecimonas sp. GXIMD4217 TaxID=3131927 RepID=UPI00311B1167
MDNGFRLYYLGMLLPGFKRAEVEKALQDRLRFSAAQATELLKGPKAVQKNITRDKAERLAASLESLGLAVKVMAPDEVLPQELDAPFQAPMAPVASQAKYGLGLLTTGTAVLLLPLLYLLLVVSLVATSLWLTLRGHTLFDWDGLFVFKAVFLVGLILTTVLLSLFMLKPWLVHHGEPQYKALKELEHPLLFRLVHNLCDHMGVPHPVEIRVDCEVNASAGFHQGLHGYRHNELVLTLGLPLVSGMTVTQLTEVLAHEFGHFAQRRGMLLYYLINKVNGWFADCAFREDDWDQRLGHWSQDDDHGWLAIPLQMARLGIGLNRALMKGLYLASHGLSQFLSRQMEYDADSHASRICGSALAKPNALLLRELSLAAARSHQLNHQAWANKVLLEDFPAAVVRNHQLLSDDDRADILVAMEKRQTRTWDSHPADLDRVRHAEALAEPGYFRLDKPAAGLFQDYARLCRFVTALDYALWGHRDIGKLTRPNDWVFSLCESQDRDDQRLARYHRGLYHPALLPDPAEPLPDELKGLDARALAERMDKRQAWLEESRDNYLQRLDGYRHAHVGSLALEVGFDVDHSEFELFSRDLGRHRQQFERWRSELRDAARPLREGNQLLVAKLRQDLRHCQGDDRQRALAHLKALKGFKDLEPALHELELGRHLLRSLAQWDSSAGSQEKFQHAYLRLREAATGDLNGLLRQADALPTAALDGKLLAFIQGWMNEPQQPLETLKEEAFLQHLEAATWAVRHQYQRHLAALVSLLSAAKASAPPSPAVAAAG